MKNGYIMTTKDNKTGVGGAFGGRRKESRPSLKSVKNFIFTVMRGGKSQTIP